MICLALLALVNAAVAQLPWSSVTVNGTSTSATSAILRDGAVMQFPSTDGTRVVIVPTQPVTRVFLRRDCTGNGEVYAPHLMGLKVDAAWLAARSDFDWQGDEADFDLSFPGLAFAPLVGQFGGGVGWLVGDTDLEPCRVLYTSSRLALEYRFDPPLQPGQTLVLNTIVVSAPAPDGRTAMGNLLRAFTKMVPDDGEYPELQPLNGYLNVQLQGHARPLQHAARLLADYGGQFGRIQFWGWSSDRYSPTSPGTGCCLALGVPHPRYGAFGDLLSMASLLGATPAIYFRSDDPALDAHLALWPGVARYIDLAGFRANCRRSYGPQTTIIEGVSAACEHAGLVAGSVTGGTTRLTGGVRAYETPVPWFGRLVFTDRPLFLGDSNFDWHWTNSLDNCQQCWLPHRFQTYRAAFLLGCKLDLRDPSKAIVQDIVAQWTASNFWARGSQYLDVMGLTEIPSAAGITRFRDQTGKTLLAVDRYYDPNWGTAKQCRVDGTMVTLPGKRLAIVELP